MLQLEPGDEVVILTQPYQGQVCTVVAVSYPPPPVPPQPTPRDWRPPDQSAVVTCRWTRDGETVFQSFHDNNLRKP